MFSRILGDSIRIGFLRGRQSRAGEGQQQQNPSFAAQRKGRPCSRLVRFRNPLAFGLSGQTGTLSRALGITALFLEQGAKMGTIQSVHSSQVDEQVLVTEER